MFEVFLSGISCFYAIYIILKLRNKYFRNKSWIELGKVNTFDSWKYRILAILFCICILYPAILASSIYTTGGWIYCTGETLAIISKLSVLFAILNIFRYSYIIHPFDFKMANLMALIFFPVACFSTQNWKSILIIWSIISIILFIKYLLEDKTEKPSINILIEILYFFAIPISLFTQILLNYLYIVW